MKVRFFIVLMIFTSLISFSNPVNSEEPNQPPVAEKAGADVETKPAESAPEAAPPTPAPVAQQPVEGNNIVLVDDSLPEGSSTEGTWIWDETLKYSGEKSHTAPAGKGITEHSYKSNPIDIPANSVIEQYVYLDPLNIPKGIMLKFRFEDSGAIGEIGVYREDEEEVFVFNSDEPMLYDGTLPNAGRWERLLFNSEDLGLVGAKLIGISYVTYGGKAYWDLTRIVPLEKEEKSPSERIPAG